MISTSAAFQTAASADFRRPKVKVEMLYTDPFIQSGNTVTATDRNNHGGVSDAVKDALLSHLTDTKVTTPHKYVVNDGTTLNDGTWWPCPGTVQEAADSQFGWYSAEVADGSGDFATPPEATVTFSDVRSIQLIRIVGEPTIGQYPVDFDVYVYDSLAVELASDSVTGNADVEYVVDLSSENITTAKSIKLVVSKWSDADTVLKIVEFFGVITDTFYMDDIVSLDILEEMESDNATSPIGNMSINEMRLDLQNIELTRENGDVVTNPFFPDNISSYLHNTITPNVRITPYVGFRLPDTSIEYVKMGVFWSTDWMVGEDDFSASVIARDRFEILRNNDFVWDTILENGTLYEIAESVLTQAKYDIPMNDLQWDIDASLSGYTVDWPWFGKVTFYEAISKIAAACQGRAYMNRNDVLVIESFLSDSVSGSADLTLSRDDYFIQKRVINSSGLKNYIVVPVSELQPEDEAGEVYTSDSILVDSGDTSKTVSVEFGDDAIIELDAEPFDQSGVIMAISSIDLKPYGGSVTFSKSSGTSGTFKVRITGRKIINVETPDEIQSDSASILLYNKRIHTVQQNHLIQSGVVAASIGNALLTSLKDPRRDVEIEYQGNPAIEIGDIADIEVYSPSSTYDEFRIMRQQFKFDSDGLRCQITGRKTVAFGS